MDYKQKQEEKKRIKNLMLGSYPEGTVKITAGESELHARVKTQVAHWLKCNEYDIWTEVTFKNYLRADILAIHKSGISYCFEIICSEKEKSILKKKEEYPLDIIVVNTKEFNYETFCL